MLVCACNRSFADSWEFFFAPHSQISRISRSFIGCFVSNNFVCLISPAKNDAKSSIQSSNCTNRPKFIYINLSHFNQFLRMLIFANLPTINSDASCWSNWQSIILQVNVTLRCWSSGLKYTYTRENKKKRQQYYNNSSSSSFNRIEIWPLLIFFTFVSLHLLR